MYDKVIVGQFVSGVNYKYTRFVVIISLSRNLSVMYFEKLLTLSGSSIAQNQAR